MSVRGVGVVVREAAGVGAPVGEPPAERARRPRATQTPTATTSSAATRLIQGKRVSGRM